MSWSDALDGGRPRGRAKTLAKRSNTIWTTECKLCGFKFGLGCWAESTFSHLDDWTQTMESMWVAVGEHQWCCARSCRMQKWSNSYNSQKLPCLKSGATPHPRWHQHLEWIEGASPMKMPTNWGPNRFCSKHPSMRKYCHFRWIH